MAVPIVKWVGGKTKLLPELRARLPKKYKRYYEPFLGGAALFFALAPHARQPVLGDMNAALIEMYKAIATIPDQVIELLEAHRTAHARESYYYEVRNDWNSARWGYYEPAERAAAFIYLNKTCFNGVWRVNKKGAFNVPKGAYARPTIFDPETLMVASEILKGAQLSHGGYDATTTSASDGDFVYFDPPYDPVSRTSDFTAYVKEPFGKEQQRQLSELARELKARGVHVMLSNNDTEYVRSLYADFCIDDVTCGRSINSNGGKRGGVKEVIITSYGETT